MSSAAFHSQILLNDPPERHRAHGKSALSRLSPLFSLLPLGSGQQQARAICALADLPDEHAQDATQAWFELVCAHALDFHADAGKIGARWDLACIDSIETWKLLRDQSDGSAFIWDLPSAGFDVQYQTGESTLDVERMLFGAPAKALPIMIGDWKRALWRRDWKSAASETAALSEILPKADLPSLAMALGCLWAIAVVGEVADMDQLDIGGVAPDGQILTIRWPRLA